MYHDDDKSQECFRKYPTVEASYRDHSIFLQKERYAPLFELDILDYKGWAKGLKKQAMPPIQGIHSYLFKLLRTIIYINLILMKILQ